MIMEVRIKDKTSGINRKGGSTTDRSRTHTAPASFDAGTNPSTQKLVTPMSRQTLVLVLVLGTCGAWRG
jgi:hypothetical protein